MSEDKEKNGSGREELQDILTEVMQIALVKYNKTRASNRDRQAWGRLIVSASEASSKILRDLDLNDLLQRVEALEAVKK